MFGGFLGMFGVFVIIMFFYEGCKWRSENGPDNIINPKEEEQAPNPNNNFTEYESTWTWILFKD